MLALISSVSPAGVKPLIGKEFASVLRERNADWDYFLELSPGNKKKLDEASRKLAKKLRRFSDQTPCGCCDNDPKCTNQEDCTGNWKCYKRPGKDKS